MRRFALLFALAVVGCSENGGVTPDAPTCSPGLDLCGSVCVDLDTDDANCGACGNGCADGQACMEGACVLACPPDRIACGGECIDPDSNPMYCGAMGDCTGPNAGEACDAEEVCSAGKCTPLCEPDRVACDGACIDPDTDPTYCGAMGDCMGANAGTTCTTNQRCFQGTCVDPFELVTFPIAVPGSTHGLGQFVLGFDGDLFVAGAGALGVFRVDSRTGAVTDFASSLVPNGFVLSLAYDAAGNALYAGAENSRLIRLDAAGTPTNLGTVPGQINALAFAPAGFGAYGGLLVAGTTTGLYAIDTTASPIAVTPISTGIGNVSDFEFVGTTLYAVVEDDVLAVASTGTATTLTSVDGARLDGIVYDAKRDVFYVADSTADVLWRMTPAGGTTSIGSYNFDSGFFISGLLLVTPDRLLLGTGETSLTIEALALP